MKQRSIVIAAAAVLALVVWIAWLFWHSTWSGPTAAALVSATPAAETPAPTTAQSQPVEPPAGSPTRVVTTATPAPVIAAVTGTLGRNSPSPAPGSPQTNQTGAAPHKIDRAAAMIELQKVHTMIASYHTLMGQNPVGTNAEIMKALMGGNPHQAMLGPPPGQVLNDKGELLDPWGTPYFFHQLSGDDMEIHSAGPDKIMGTGDDLVIH